MHRKKLREMNVELLDTDATSCSVTGNNCDFAHMASCFLMKVYNCSVEVRDPFFTKWTQLCCHLCVCISAFFC